MCEVHERHIPWFHSAGPGDQKAIAERLEQPAAPRGAGHTPPRVVGCRAVECRVINLYHICNCY